MVFVYILLAFAAIMIVFIAIIALQPSAFRIVRSVAMTAPPAEVFAQVNDFHQWQAWSPWAKIDPALKQTYEGAPAGAGAIYSWVGNSKAGEGRMTILESNPSDLIHIKLEFLKPFKATNTAEFTFKPEGNQTVVTWSLSGDRSFFLKAFALFINMDKLVGGDFEKGLAAMKTVAEAKAKLNPTEHP